MNLYQTSIVIVILVVIIFFIKRLILSTENKDLVVMNNDNDNTLIQNYIKKNVYHKRIVLVIESFDNIDRLLTFIRNILNQEIKVNSIILISNNINLKKVQLIHDTCIINKIGGLSLLLKESNNSTIILFVSSVGFNAFINPQFLKNFISSDKGEIGVVKVNTNNINVDISKIYE